MSLALALQILLALIQAAPAITDGIKTIAKIVRDHTAKHGAAAAATPLSADHEALVRAQMPSDDPFSSDPSYES